MLPPKSIAGSDGNRHGNTAPGTVHVWCDEGAGNAFVLSTDDSRSVYAALCARNERRFLGSKLTALVDVVGTAPTIDLHALDVTITGSEHLRLALLGKSLLVALGTQGWLARFELASGKLTHNSTVTDVDFPNILRPLDSAPELVVLGAVNGLSLFDTTQWAGQNFILFYYFLIIYIYISVYLFVLLKKKKTKQKVVGNAFHTMAFAASLFTGPVAILENANNQKIDVVFSNIMPGGNGNQPFYMVSTITADKTNGFAKEIVANISTPCHIYGGAFPDVHLTTDSHNGNSLLIFGCYLDNGRKNYIGYDLANHQTLYSIYGGTGRITDKTIVVSSYEKDPNSPSTHPVVQSFDKR